MSFQPFALENFLSEHEQLATLNFSESGVHPLTLAELFCLADRDLSELGSVLLNYPEVNGLELLRERIAALYPRADASQVLVTVGATEANHLVAQTLLQPGDEMVVFSPTYQQLAGNATNRGIKVRTVPLLESAGWSVDAAVLDDAVTPRTRVIALVNPNNPTGRILAAEERSAIVAAASRVGAWIIADEVYAGTERATDESTATFWGDYDRVVAINSMSKAYGLPGLRLGWLVAPEALIPPLWRRHEYAAISATMLGMELASIVLEPQVRLRARDRARQLIRRGFETFEATLAQFPDVFEVVAPDASAMSFPRFDLPVDASRLASTLLNEHGVLVIPGSCFGYEKHFRFSSALPPDYLAEGLERLARTVEKLRSL